MRVTKRDGRLEDVSFDKVLCRIKLLSENLKLVDATVVAQKVCARIYDKVTTSELDELAASICTSMSTDIPDYGILASRVIISNNHKNTPTTFFECKQLYNSLKIISLDIFKFSILLLNFLKSYCQYNISVSESRIPRVIPEKSGALHL